MTDKPVPESAQPQLCINCGEEIIQGPSGFWTHRAGHSCCGPHKFATPKQAESAPLSDKEVVLQVHPDAYMACDYSMSKAPDEYDIIVRSTGKTIGHGVTQHKAWADARSRLSPAQPPAPLEPCAIPPAGWTCSRGKGHEGPCAASPVEDDSYVAWVRYRNHNGRHATTIHICNPDDEGAFKVYRHPSAPPHCEECKWTDGYGHAATCSKSQAGVVQPPAQGEGQREKHEPLEWGTNCLSAPDRGPHECAGDNGICLTDQKHVCCRCGAFCLCRPCNGGNPRTRSSVSDRWVHTDTRVGRVICVDPPIDPIPTPKPVESEPLTVKESPDEFLLQLLPLLDEAERGALRMERRERGGISVAGAIRKVSDRIIARVESHLAPVAPATDEPQNGGLCWCGLTAGHTCAHYKGAGGESPLEPADAAPLCVGKITKDDVDFIKSMCFQGPDMSERQERRVRRIIDELRLLANNPVAPPSPQRWIATSPERRVDELEWVLRQIITDLPISRDWLDPTVEAVARKLLGATL